MRRLRDYWPILCAALGALVITPLLPHAQAQTADWTVISTPRVVIAGDHLAIAITTPASSTGEVLIVLRAGLQLVSAEASSGAFVDGHWQLTGASQPATLVLLAVVSAQANTDADVTVAATWNGDERQTTTALIGPAGPPSPSQCLFVPLVQHAPH